MSETGKSKIQYIFTWISLGVLVTGALGMLISSWNGVQRGQISHPILILFLSLVLSSGIFLFMLAVKKAHRQWVQEERQKKENESEAGRSLREKSPRKDKVSLDPAVTARKMVRRISEDSSLELLGKEIMSNLSRELEIMSGIYFIRKGKVFSSTATYAQNTPKPPEDFSPGEGLNGQVAQIGQIRILTTLPEGYLEIYSGLGKAPPTYLAIVPLIRQEECVALFECAGYKYNAQEIESTLRIFSRDLSEKLFNPGES